MRGISEEMLYKCLATAKSKEILVYDERFGAIRAMFIYGGWRTGNVNLRNIDPTHRTPLPEPPK